MKQIILNFLNKIKNYVPWILLILVVFMFMRINSCNSARQDREMKELKDSAQIYKDQSGNEHAKFQEATLQNDQMQEVVDSMAKALKLKPKQVIKYVKAGFVIDTVLVAKSDTITVTDTITGEKIVSYKLDFQDSSFLKVHAIVPQNPQKIEVGLNADVTLTEYWKRKKVLGLSIGKKVYYSDIGTNNKYINISNAQSYKLADQPKLRIKAGIGIGVNYDPFTRTIHPGIQAGIYLSRSR